MRKGRWDWQKDRAKGAKHARLIERQPDLREALYGGNARERRSLARLDSLTAARDTAHSRNDDG